MIDLVRAALPVVVLVGVVGCGLMAGLFFAFSAAVMPGLRRMPPSVAAAAMQSMNRAILNPVFGLLLGGTTLACVGVVVGALLVDHGGAPWLVAGAAAYLLGGFGLTAVVNVPLNDQLDAVDPASAAGARIWADFRPRWTGSNHIRTVASTVATAALAMGGWT